MAQITVRNASSIPQMAQIILPDASLRHRWHRSLCQTQPPRHRCRRLSQTTRRRWHRSLFQTLSPQHRCNKLSFQTQPRSTDGTDHLARYDRQGTDCTDRFSLSRQKLAAQMAHHLCRRSPCQTQTQMAQIAQVFSSDASLRHTWHRSLCQAQPQMSQMASRSSFENQARE